MHEFSLNSFATKALKNNPIFQSQGIIDIKAFNQRNSKEVLVIYSFLYKDVELLVKRELPSNYSEQNIIEDINYEIEVFNIYLPKPATGNYVLRHANSRHLFNTENSELDGIKYNMRILRLLDREGDLFYRVNELNSCGDIEMFIIENCAEVD